MKCSDTLSVDSRDWDEVTPLTRALRHYFFKMLLALPVTERLFLMAMSREFRGRQDTPPKQRRSSAPSCLTSVSLLGKLEESGRSRRERHWTMGSRAELTLVSTTVKMTLVGTRLSVIRIVLTTQQRQGREQAAHHFCESILGNLGADVQVQNTYRTVLPQAYYTSFKTWPEQKLVPQHVQPIHACCRVTPELLARPTDCLFRPSL